MAVEIFIKVDKSKVPAYQTFADDHGDEISISKLMMFDNVGLVLMENGEFQWGSSVDVGGSAPSYSMWVSVMCNLHQFF